jgi:hypothetical protein
MKKYEINLRRRNIPQSDFINDIKGVATSLNQVTLTADAYKQHGKFGKTTILRRFGSWNKALATAGLKVILNLNIKNELLFENLADVWQHFGRQPVGKDIDKSLGISRYSLGTYEKRFGSWNKALEAFASHINNSSESEDQAPEKHQSSKTITPQSTQAPRKINWRLRSMVLIRDNCICRMCGASPSKDPQVVLHVDHVEPWSKGGATSMENLQTLCSVCNIGKSNETL